MSTKSTTQDAIKKTKMLTDVEHVLMRPHIYMGPIETQERICTTAHLNENNQLEFEQFGKLHYPPALITLFNELINNSYDEYVRTKLHTSKADRLENIWVTIDQRNASFTVRDDGGIHVEKHPEYNMYLPEIYFGYLRSGVNYDDERGATAGTNGVGSSLVNIFSKRFEVITCDGINKFHGIWTDNMSNKDIKSITPAGRLSNGTAITAEIDMARFQNIESTTSFSDDMVNAMITRSIEVAAMGQDAKRPLKIHLAVLSDNEELRLFSNTYQYNAYWQHTKQYRGIVIDDVNYFWGEQYERCDFEIGPSDGGNLQSIALVNSIRCDFGTHVDMIADHVANHLRWYLNKQHKIDVKPAQIKKGLRIFSRWIIDAPDFATQTKEYLTTKPDKFGFEFIMTDKFKRSLEKSEVTLRIIDAHHAIEAAKAKQHVRAAQKNNAKGNHYSKNLIDASSHDRSQCDIFIVEGDSAIGGIRNNRDSLTQGAFALRGIFNNCLYRTPKQLLTGRGDKETEASKLCRALGLQFDEPPTNMRYNNIYIMTDADYDGYAIASQLILFFRKFWPDIILEKRLHIVQSPVAVAKKAKQHTKLYYTMQDFFNDEQSLVDSGYNIKYAKGLAALGTAEYSNLLKEPKLLTIVEDEHAWFTLDAWFNNNADGRKEMLSTITIDDNY